VIEPLQYTVVDGIRCYSPSVAANYTDYPHAGFDLTEKNSGNSFWVRSRNRLFKRLVERNLKPAGKTVLLEIGCGTGDFIRHLAASEKLEIIGSEVYLEGLVYAKKNLPHVDFVQFDVTQGTIGIEFDMICAFDVIEHIDDDRTALANIHRMLKPNGVVLLSVPQHTFLWSRLDELVKHKRRYSKRELLAKLEETGFDVAYTSSFVFVLFPLMLLSRLFDRGRGSPAGGELELEKRVTFPGFANAVFGSLMRIDETLIHSGLSLPFGGTLIAVARKRG
jgi:2-polyprenyl-3-methyl-5-hydroxy-6-metoxy-1,4-benzoquinol methylase